MTIPFGAPIIESEERQAVLNVLAGPILVHGPRATQFENDFAAFTGAPYAVSVSNCTAGMHLVYLALGLGPGDEVIVPAQTHVATAHAVEAVGATPVFVDADAETGNIDIEAVEAAVTPRTKAIAVVHFLGMPVDMDQINRIARARKLFVVEDAALAVGTRYNGTHAGCLGDVGVFSFYPVKHITTAEGGMVITKHADLAAKVRLKRAFGVDRAHGERDIPGMYDVVDFGLNYRMSEIHAALGIEQLKKAEGFVAKRRANYNALSRALGNHERFSLLRSTHGGFESSYYCLSVVLDEAAAEKRPAIMAAMKDQGVGTSIYYPKPVPRMTVYRNKYGYEPARYTNAARISDRSIALPVGPHLDEADMHVVAKALTHAIERVA